MKPKEILEILREVWKEVSPFLPPWLISVLEASKYVVLLLLAVWVLLFLSSQIKKLWLELFGPLLYDEEKKRRSYRRQLFADHVESELRRLNGLEEWADYRFAELEAEVEAEGRRRRFGLWPRTMTGLRREKSLSRALRTSTERRILVEGDPGAGKSVALRHVAVQLARKAMTARRTDSLIPIYVNLKELNRPEGREIDSSLIRDFVLASLNRVNNRDVDEFLEDEFERGLKDGSWIFLFDSFDELPEVLSATEADSTVRQYADAIVSFLSGFNQCRGIIASRAFRGPKHITLPHFRILPLTEARRLKLIRQSGLNIRKERELIGQLATGNDDIKFMASNPMYLGLVCHRLRDGLEFPENAHSVFETYIAGRLKRDATRVNARFSLDPEQVRQIAEAAAFAISTIRNLGLSPKRDALEQEIGRQEPHMTSIVGRGLDALQYIKLARQEVAVSLDEKSVFSFSHRRFQEYFATCAILDNPERVTAKALISDARWREAAVVMSQTQPVATLWPLFEEITRELEQAEAAISNSSVQENGESPTRRSFPWPSSALHILSILQDGFRGQAERLPEEIRSSAARLLVHAYDSGLIIDQKWAVEVAGGLPSSDLLQLLRSAFENDSWWLKEAAFRQIAALGEIPHDLSKSIRSCLEHLARTGRLRRERHATDAHLRKLHGALEYLGAARVLIWLPLIDLALLVAVSLVSFTVLLSDVGLTFAAVLTVPMITLLIYNLWTKSDFSFTYDYLRFFLFALFPAAVLADGLFSDIFSIFSEKEPMTIFGSIKGDLAAFSNLVIYIMALASCVSWKYLALGAARLGAFVEPFWWPIYPVLVPGLLVLKPIEIHVLVKRSRGRLLFAPFLIAVTFLSAVLFVCICVPIVWMIVLISNSIVEFINRFDLAMILAFALYGWGAVLGLIQLAKYLLDIRDLRGLWREPGELEVGAFLSLLATLRSGGTRLRLLRYVRENALLVSSAQALEVLQDLLVAAENAENTSGEWISQSFGKWYKSLELRDIFSRRWSSELIDEIGKLVEQAYQIRRAKEPEDDRNLSLPGSEREMKVMGQR